MLTYEDCLGLSPLTEAEVGAIAEHEHIPRIVAVEMGTCLMRKPGGVAAIRRMILDDLNHAETRGNTAHAHELRLLFWHFLATHPDAQEKQAS
jgi:hypothetical protein